MKPSLDEGCVLCCTDGTLNSVAAVEESFLVVVVIDRRCLFGTSNDFTRCSRRLSTLGVYTETRSMKVHFCHCFRLQKIDTFLLGAFHYIIKTTTVKELKSCKNICLQASKSFVFVRHRSHSVPPLVPFQAAVTMTLIRSSPPPP